MIVYPATLTRSGPTPRRLIKDLRDNPMDEVELRDDEIAQPRPYSYEMQDDAWVCYHCGYRCLSVWSARLHFGETPNCIPACKLPGVNVSKLILRHTRAIEREYIQQLDVYSRALTQKTFEAAWAKAKNLDDLQEPTHGDIVKGFKTAAKLQTLTVYTRLGNVSVMLRPSGEVQWFGSLELPRMGLIPYSAFTDEDLERIFGLDTYEINLGQRVELIYSKFAR